jgi:integrase
MYKTDWVQSMDRLGLPGEAQTRLHKGLDQAGLLLSSNKSTNDTDHIGSPFAMLLMLAADFVDRPEAFSALLQADFALTPLLAHQTRAIVMDVIRHHGNLQHQSLPAIDSRTPSLGPIPQLEGKDSHSLNPGLPNPIEADVYQRVSHSSTAQADPINIVVTPKEKNGPGVSYRQVVVDERAKRRRSKVSSSLSSADSSSVGEAQPRNIDVNPTYDYGLPKNYHSRFPILSSELHEFFLFMTQPTPFAQEDPIRDATATVYVRHAKLFLGWYLSQYSTLERHQEQPTNDLAKGEERGEKRDTHVSIFQIFPDKEKNSATVLIDFIIWLRSSREVSVSYEANMLRGLIKLLKFRFARESLTDPAYGDGGKVTFDDIPIIRELRKIHRSANQRQRNAPRSSNEQRKWLSWPEYLKVVDSTKLELQSLLQEYNKQHTEPERRLRNDPPYTYQEKNIAAVYQRFLILAFFSNVPDRQRTIRELEIGRTFVRDETSELTSQGGEDHACWAIKHGPDDYKTGKSYGERPAIHLARELTPAIDDFVAIWRPFLEPSTNYFFVQARGGKPMTGDSVYRRVCQSCYKYTGKRTNPHLLRDMIVTHVRESADASEQQLEALALYMGHSLHMQRTSYDRRTLTKKIAPAVELMQSVNKKTH